MNNFKVGVLYDISYKFKYSLSRFDRKETTINLKQQMFCKSTPCYFVFWNKKGYVRVLKSNLLSAEIS